MKKIKQIKRNFLIRLMSVLGFGGMAAFCLASCEQASTNDAQPASETPTAAVDSDEDAQVKVLKLEPVPNTEMINMRYIEVVQQKRPRPKYGPPDWRDRTNIDTINIFELRK